MTFCHWYIGALLFLLYWNAIAICFAQLNFKFDAEHDQSSPNQVLEFNNLVVDRDLNGKIYVGARNRLYQLNHDLVIESRPDETGPVQDGVVCHLQNVEEFTDNINKLLLVDSQNDRIISCGSVEQGICDLRQTGNINNHLTNRNSSDYYNGKHVAATGNLSTTAFIATLADNEFFLFVGSSKTELDVEESKCSLFSTYFTISKRVLPKDNTSPVMFSNFLSIPNSDSKITLGITMKKKKFADKHFRVTFLESFAHGITGYFVLKHPLTSSNNFGNSAKSTYIGQVCLEDNELNSYLELPLQCNDKGIEYTVAVASRAAPVGSILKNNLNLVSSTSQSSSESPVVFISFVRANGLPGSAVCMFPLQLIEEMFTQLVRNCMHYSAAKPPQHIEWIKGSESLACRGNFDVTTPVCHTTKHMWDVVKYLKSDPFLADAVFLSEESVFTAIEVTRTNDDMHTVLLLGTENGNVLKVTVDSPELDSPESKPYETLPINPLNSYSRFPKSYFSVNQIKLGGAPGSQRIYAMTPSVIVGVPLYNCARYQTCTECLNSNDPFCGWCTLDSNLQVTGLAVTAKTKCTSYDNCHTSTSSKPFMFIESGKQCPSITSSKDLPLVLTVAQSQTQIFLRGHNIPSLQDRYYCFFGNIYRQQVTRIQKENSAQNSPLLIQCVTPPPSHIPRFPPEEGNLTMTLSLVYGVGEKETVIASTDFTFYNCSVFTSCMSCVQSHFNCSWCLDDSICRYQSTSYCPQNNVQLSNTCPQLSSHDEDNKVYLSAGETRDLSLPVSNLPHNWLSFTCDVDFHDGKDAVSFYGMRGIGGTHVVCRDVKVQELLPVNVRNITASVQVRANRNSQKISIDNPNNIGIEIYRCSLGNNENCGQCLESPSAWRCGWCQNGNRCTLSRDCSDWLQDNRYVTCRNPRITGFWPKTAPFGSDETIITLRGFNFDSRERMLVEVADVPCQVMSATCCEVQCRPSSLSSKTVGQVMLCITNDNVNCLPGGGYTTWSGEVFSFVDPKITSFKPSSGLRGWGSTVTMYGRDLDAGSNVSVSVAESPCIVQSRSASEMRCRLSCGGGKSKRDVAKSVLERLYRPKRNSFHSKSALVASFDGVHKLSKDGYFIFEDNPSIKVVDPSCTIRSGGLFVIIQGIGVSLIPDPRIIVRLDNGYSFTQICEEFEGASIKCQTPDVSSYPFFESRDMIFNAEVGVYNFGCESNILWSDTPMRYGPNPLLDMFEGETETKKFLAEAIRITGTNLCADESHCDASSVRVTIGDDMACNVTRLNMREITCFPQSSKSEGSFAVTVFVGGYSQQVGYLEYSSPGFPFYFIFIFVGIALVVLLIITTVVCVYRKRAEASDQELKNVQMQMDLMDSKVAKICKEAFAELQTDMCQLDTNAGGTALVPYLSYPTYLMRVLFPDPNNIDLQHSLLCSTMKRDGSFGDQRSIYNRSQGGMERFDQLLGNKIFLLCLIKTIEKQESFLVKDRAKVAGLIMIILHNRLQYATEILEHLLADLIHRNMESRSHPKLLLRRTESVAEKMLTHWFSILLHGFVEECAGDPLYTLFRAIKQQVDKGPLDSFTSEARYSLSEDKLLRQSVDHDVIHLRVMNYLSDDDQPECTVKVLNCDSILQVKRKILDVLYLSVGYSSRPHPEDIDIEVMHGNLLPLFLHDEDQTSEVEPEWKRVNTLKHYDIKSRTRVSLIPKKEPSIVNYSLTTAPSKMSLFRTNGTGSRAFSSGDSVTSSLPRHRQPLMGTLTLSHHTTQPPKQWHLVKANDQDQPEGGDRGSKMVSEVYLTRLLTTKGTIQKYVDDLFETIFSVVQRGNDLPIAVKHMFDFLDHQAEIHGITDPDVVHTWKSNCLPLRFWVNLIKNPEFIYDIHKSPIVDCYLSVIAQAFMDSCSTAEYKLGKDSPSNKLLYAKEIPEYRKWVEKYYSDISNRSKLHPRDLAQFLQDESKMHANEFNRPVALTQLFTYVQKYSNDILTQLRTEAEPHRQRLDLQLDELLRAVNGKT